MKKLLQDFLPIILFFVVYKMTGDLITATALLIPATILQIGFVWWVTKKIESMYLITLVLVVLLGGATVLFHDGTFIKWKPTVVNWVFAGVFFASQYIGSQNLLQRATSHQVTLPAYIWKRLNYAWITFFVVVGAVNLFVAFSGYFSESAWVDFKLFGMLGLTFVFVVAQSLYIVRYIPEDDSATLVSHEEVGE